MIKLFSKFPVQGWFASGGKTLLSVCVLLSFTFLVFNFNKDDKVRYVEAALTSCKGPADVMLVIDRSGTMGNNLKFSNTKSESINFVGKLFSAIPEGGPEGFNYHQIGLVAFNQLTATVNLNQGGDEIKNSINDPEGILGDSYPVGSRNTDTAIQQARLKLGTENGGNPFATKTMIILTDGAPNNLDAAKTQAVLAKNNDIRIISIGLELDAIEDGTIEDAKEFIKYASSSPTDCYYIYDSGDELENCTSISLDELGATLNGIYDSITAAVCDESPPTVSISRKPSGTLYSVDNLVVTSEAIDDVGFKSHKIIWSDIWPSNLQTIECADLMGTMTELGSSISCDTGELGSFPVDKIISYRSIVIDTNDNEVNIDPPKTVTVANVSLTVPSPSFSRIRDNNIKVVISSHGGGDDLFISIDTTPALEGVEIDKASITDCSDSGDTRTCTYNFNPDCSWTDGITGGVANDISVNVYIYAESADMGIRQIASSENNSLVSYFEGKDWPGTCSDGKNNDCNYDISNDPIIDSEEMLCDTVGPIIGVSRLPSDTIYDFESDGITPMLVTISSIATDDLAHNNGIKQHTIYYRENGGDWQIFDCNDVDPGDGKIICDGIEISQNIATISTLIGSFTAGAIVEYYSTAIDYSGNNNSNGTTTESFIVRNRSCFGKDDLEDCVGVPGKCCGEVCNSTISNPNNYNTNCAQEICGDALEYEEDVRVAGKYGNAVNFDGVNDYVAIPTIDPDGDPNVSASVNPTDAITVAAWVKSATDTGYSGYWQIVSKYSAYLLGTSGSGSKQMCFIVHSGGGWKYGNCYTVSDPQEWHHFAGTYDKLTGEKKLYVDGELQGAPVSFTSKINPDTGPINIGKAECCNSYFKGIVDEVYIYSRALDLGEVKSVRDGTFTNVANLAAYWSFDEEFGDVAYDNSGSGNYGTLINFPTPIVKPGILWQLDADESKNGLTPCSNDGSSNGCYLFANLFGTGCEDRMYSCSSGYCNYSSDREKDRCDYDTGIFYDYGCVGSCSLISAEVNPICDTIISGIVSVDAYNSDSPSEFIAGTSGSVTGDVYNNMTNKISLIAEASDANGISEQKIYWKKSVDASFAELDCDISLCNFSADTCTCTEEIGPFNIGDTVQFYTKVKDNSPNYNELTTPTYSFTVFDWQCYDIDLGMIKTNSTPCITGKCCGGICDTSEIENPFSYHDDCRVEACEATALVYDWGNDGVSCPSGSTETCFDYYTGCVGGNKCTFGHCSPDTDGVSVDSCSENIFTDNGCDSGVCGLISGGTDCSVIGNSDGDSIACNCDCNNYDIEERVYSSLYFDGVDDYVEIPDDLSLNISDEISIEVWVKDVVGTGGSQDNDTINDNDFVSKIRATIGTGENDGDYDKLSAWEAAIGSNLTAATSQIFTVSDRGTYDYLTDDGQVVTFSGGGTGILKHLNTYNKAYIISVAGTVNVGAVTVDATGHTFIISDTGQQIGRVIAECYNDWSVGLSDNLSVAGWTTDATHYVKVYTPFLERHNGRVKEGGNYTGFALVGDGGTKIGISQKYTEINGIILDSTVNYNTGIAISYSDGNFSKISNCIFQNFGVPDQAYSGLTIGDYKYAYIFNNIFIKSYVLISNTAFPSNHVWVYNNTFYNCQLNGGNDNRTIAKNNIVYYSGACYQGSYEASSSNNISVDATAPGAGSLINKTLGEIAFIDTSADAEDLHLSSLSCARNVGVNLKDDISSDIDNNSYFSLWDIGADKYPEGVIVGKGIGEEAYSLTIDGDGDISGNINNQDVFAQIADNNWHQVVMTYNGNSQKLYLDGSETDSKVLIGAININADNLVVSKGSAGMIDEIRIYNRALYPEEVKDHYDGIFIDNSGLIGHWNFDKGTGEVVKDSSVNANNGALKNGPVWMKHHHGSTSGPNGNVPENWQACTDGKDNDCDGTSDEYTGFISDCDGEVFVSATASAKDKNGVEVSDLFATDSNITIYDNDIREVANEFKIKAEATDDFSIVQLIIEWTTDNWGTTKNETCNNTGFCEVCIEGGSCEADHDNILLSSLLADNTFKFKVCAVDGSANNNQKCTIEHSMEIKSFNAVPVITPLTVVDPDFCSERLKYILKWEFNDDGDAQNNFEIQIKENDFSSPGNLIIDKNFDLPNLFYQINSDDFETGESIEYREKEYYWRVKVTDDRGSGYEQTTEWEVGPVFTTPLYGYPEVDFIVTPDYSNPCLYETDHVGSVETCDWGENITFSPNNLIFIECINNEHCQTSTNAKCDTVNNVCVPCGDNSECVKFDLGVLNYSCNGGICETSDSCADNNDCLAADAAKCDIGLCVACDDDFQCGKFNLGNISSGLLGNVSSGGTDTLTDSSKSWLANEWTGGAIKIVSGTGVGQIKSIISNNASEITVNSSWTVDPDSSSEYRIIKYFCNNEGLCENKEHRKWWFDDSITYPDSRDPNPLINYIDSEVNNHDVTFEISDIMNNSCRKIKNIRLGGREYPKWNEVAPHN